MVASGAAGPGWSSIPLRRGLLAIALHLRSHLVPLALLLNIAAAGSHAALPLIDSRSYTLLRLPPWSACLTVLKAWGSLLRHVCCAGGQALQAFDLADLERSCETTCLESAPKSSLRLEQLNLQRVLTAARSKNKVSSRAV